MDIAKFNKELGYKVAKASGFENNNKIQEAIDEWVEISEMVIEVSKTSNLEYSYKSMLIKKTEQIIEHIKALKAKLKGDEQIPLIIEEEDNTESTQQESEISVESLDKESDSTGSEILDEYNVAYTKNSTPSDHDIKIIEDSEFKNLPKGFKEIKPSKDFEIITPHDKEYINKILSDDKLDMNVFKYSKKEKFSQNSNSVNKEIHSDKEQDKTICFACGQELSSNVKKCPNCGAQQK